MDRTSQLKGLLDSGAGLETALAKLHESGATPVEVIRAIYEVQNVSLGEAKRRFAACSAWAAEAKASDILHQQILDAFKDV